MTMNNINNNMNNNNMNNINNMNNMYNTNNINNNWCDEKTHGKISKIIDELDSPSSFSLQN